MPRIQKTSDIVEQHSERAVLFAGGGFLLAGIAFFLIRYRGDGAFVPLGYVLSLGALGLFATAGYTIGKVRRVAAHTLDCPFCTERVSLSEPPGEVDVRCSGCNRMIPIHEGRIVPVSQVRCGFCNGLNHYSDKTDALLCEECNHEIPIQHEEGYVSKKSVRGFAVVEDDALYELVLTDADDSAQGHHNEGLVAALQHMLALNRNQVKGLLDEVPVTLLQGITRMKADMLKAQLANHGATAEARPLSTTSTV